MTCENVGRLCSVCRSRSMCARLRAESSRRCGCQATAQLARSYAVLCSADAVTASCTCACSIAGRWSCFVGISWLPQYAVCADLLVACHADFQIEIKKGDTVRPGDKVALVSVGATAAAPSKAAPAAAAPAASPPPPPPPPAPTAAPIPVQQVLQRPTEEPKLLPKDRERRVCSMS